MVRIGKAASESSAAVAYHLDEFTQGLSKALKPFVFSAMPLVVQRHLVRNKQHSTHIAAHGTARILSHGKERAGLHAGSQPAHRSPTSSNVIIINDHLRPKDQS